MTDQNVAYILLPKIKAYAKSFSDRTNEKAIAIEGTCTTEFLAVEAVCSDVV